ncbi:MAG: hypothetical protein E3J64_10465 [Anaerolineales bacterium]|nr:MAG: hypothetical protein E3J64_10465 [Anaerolineales bacterium]
MEPLDVLAAIRERQSVRSYADRLVASSTLQQLLDFAAAAPHVTGVPPRVALVSGVEKTEHILTHIVGSYGLVRNAPHLLVAAMPDGTPQAQIDVGYVLEQLVLEATHLGLGTCWITGTYDAERAGETIGLASGEIAGAVCSLGYAADGVLDRLHDTTIRRLAGGHRRKPLREIAFSQSWAQEWDASEADSNLVEALDCARLAPSASNRQPWRFVVAHQQVSLALVRPNYFDAGIVMSHLALASAALGHPGRWELRLADAAWVRELGTPAGVIPIATFAT